MGQTKVVIDIEGRWNDHVTNEAKAAAKAISTIEKEAQDAGKELVDLGKKKAKPTIDTDTSKAEKKIDNVKSSLKKIGSEKPKPTVDADTSRVDKKLSKVDSILKKFGLKKNLFHKFLHF